MLKIFFVAERRIGHGAREEVESAGFEIDNRTGRDANFGHSTSRVGTAAMSRFLSRKLTCHRAIGVEGIDGIVLGGDVEDVVGALAGDVDGWKE
jgi:hypothetical protein